MGIQVCKYCGKEFEGSGHRKYCDGPHYSTCKLCGKQFEITNLQDIPKTCSKECRGKYQRQQIEAALLAKYGVTHFSQSPELLAKANTTRNLHKDESTAKRNATMIERYGAAYPMQSKELRAKIEATNLQKYGVANPAHAADIRKKISDAVSSEAAQQKYHQTSQLHYGVDHPAQSVEVQDQMKSTCVERYGVPYATQNAEVKDKLSASIVRRNMMNPEAVKQHTARMHELCLEKYGVDWPCQLAQCREAAHHTISQINLAIGAKLEELGYAIQYEKSLGAYSYDICIESLKILLEVNPSYTHNTVGNHYGIVRHPDYHRLKTMAASQQGYRCIHIFDWDDLQKVYMLLLPKVTIYARDCKIHDVSSQEADEFLTLYHIQNKCRGQQVRLGLYCDNVLVQLMTFGSPRYNHKYQYELLRLCSAAGVQVVGGANRLWTAFIREYSPDSVISYCDISKFTGEVYEHLGMTRLQQTEPAKIWSRGSQKITDNLLRQRGFDQLFGTDYGKGTSNEELMLLNKWLPVYDCGQLVYIYEEEK